MTNAKSPYQADCAACNEKRRTCSLGQQNLAKGFFPTFLTKLHPDLVYTDTLPKQATLRQKRQNKGAKKSVI